MLRRILMMMVLALGVGMVANATKIYADLSAARAEGSAGAWDAEAQTFTWTAGTDARLILSGLSGDLSDCTALVLETENLVNNSGSEDTPAGYRVDLISGGETLLGYSHGMAWSEAGTFTIDLQSEFSKEQLSQVKEIRINTNSPSGSVVVKSAYLVKPFNLTFDESGKAYILPSDMAELVDGVTVDEETGEIVMSGESASITLSLGDVDFSNVTSFNIEHDITSEGYSDILTSTQLFSLTTGKSVHDWYTSKYGSDFTDDDRSKSEHISKIVLNFSNIKDNKPLTGKMKISSICITKSVITASDMLNLTAADFKTWTNVGIDAEPTATAGCTVAFGKELGAGATIYGDVNVYNLNYADISDAEYLRIKGTPGAPLRVLINRITNNDPSDGIEINPVIGDDGTVLVDLSNYEYVHLNAVKVNWGAPSCIIDAIGLIKGGVDYYIAGAGDMVTSAESALADASATRIDVTGLTDDEPITLTSANPNCLFVASDATTLANTTNVLVENEDGGYVCADLSLDAAYPYEAPFDFVATTATVKKSVSEIGFATFVSPYSVAVPDGCEAYKIVSVDADNALQCEPVTQIVANEPVLLVGEGAYGFAASDVTVSVAPETLVSGLLNGSYEATTAPAGSYVLQPQDGVTAFYRVVDDGKQQVVPFTAYLTLPATVGANVRMLSIDLGSDVTAIENVPSTAATVVAVYDLSGRSVEGLQRGINLVKMSDGTVKKVIVK